MSDASFSGKFPVKFAKIDVSTSGDSTIVAAVAGKSIRVMDFFLVVAGVTTVKWKSGATDLTGGMALAANGGLSVLGEAGVLKTGVGQALVLNNSAVIVVGGSVTYVLE